MGDYGIELHIPASPLDRNIEVTVNVRSVDDRFVFPEGSELVSAVYGISTSRQLPIPATLRIQHCIPIESYLDSEAASSNMTFVSAHHGPPYVFREVHGGKFSQGSYYGEVLVNEFSDFGITWLFSKWPWSYRPIHLYVGIYSYATSANFIVIMNLEVHIRAVNKEYGRTSVVKTLTCDRQTEDIKLVVPTTYMGWEIKPRFTPAAIDMETIRDFQPGKDCSDYEVDSQRTSSGERCNHPCSRT